MARYPIQKAGLQCTMQLTWPLRLTWPPEELRNTSFILFLANVLLFLPAARSSNWLNFGERGTISFFSEDNPNRPFKAI